MFLYRLVFLRKGMVLIMKNKFIAVALAIMLSLCSMVALSACFDDDNSTGTESVSSTIDDSSSETEDSSKDSSSETEDSSKDSSSDTEDSSKDSSSEDDSSSESEEDSETKGDNPFDYNEFN